MQHKDINMADIAKLGSTDKEEPKSSNVDNSIKATSENVIFGLTDEEIKDPRKIVVTIADRRTPIVVFFGAQSSGKTMVLLRMIRFLESRGYTVEPVRTFREGADGGHYERMCDEIRDMAYRDVTPHGTDVISFMLLKVIDPNGRPVCQLLEAPGEHYYNPTEQRGVCTFLPYINQIIDSPNRKTWVFFVEHEWQNREQRERYAAKICAMQDRISAADRVTFLFNKVDAHRHQRALFYGNDEPNLAAFYNSISNDYDGIFTRYINRGWLTRLIYGRFRFNMVCFSSGQFTPLSDGTSTWVPGRDSYCKKLIKAIL